MKNFAVVNNETNKIVNVIVVGEFIPEIENCKLIDTTGKNDAQVGGIYDEENERFIDIQPYPSWILNNETGLWEAPISKPNENYFWNESEQIWVEIQ